MISVAKTEIFLPKGIPNISQLATPLITPHVAFEVFRVQVIRHHISKNDKNLADDLVHAYTTDDCFVFKVLVYSAFSHN